LAANYYQAQVSASENISLNQILIEMLELMPMEGSLEFTVLIISAYK